MAMRVSALLLGAHHENSNSSVDLVYGCCRLHVGNEKAINTQPHSSRFDCWSGYRGSTRNHVHSQSQAQAYLMGLPSSSARLLSRGGRHDYKPHCFSLTSFSNPNLSGV